MAASADTLPGRAAPDAAVLPQALTENALRAWVVAAVPGDITLWSAISGGNRCRSWAVDVTAADGRRHALYLRYQPPRPPSAEPYTVDREARIYRILSASAVPAPHLVAAHPDGSAILTDRLPGMAEFRRIAQEADKAAIARDFVAALAILHAHPLPPAALAVPAPGDTAAAVRAEIAVWRAMYLETGRQDPLIDLALDWLEANLPPVAAPPVLVHGDAGPGNFLFENGRMTGLIDWELAHPGDPMEDLAWFSMRAVMEPVPDFAACLAHYARLSGRPLAVDRIRYHRVFVSTRVVIIRHRNVTGEPGNSIVSRSLNRRLLVDALAAASGLSLAPPAPVEAPETAQTALYDHVLADLQDRIATPAAAAGVVAAAKNAAKVTKYLREVDRLGARVALADRAAYLALPGVDPAADTDDGLRRALASGALRFDAALRFFAGRVARDAQLAAPSSGGLARRRFPDLPQSAPITPEEAAE